MIGYLVLESGETFPGILKGNLNASMGEVVFNTSHSGYEQIASDPSYFNQIVVMTAPQQGNYGVNPENWESRKYWIEGFVCLEMQDSPKNKVFLDDLAKQEIPVLTEVLTRELVLRLRSSGTIRGAIVAAHSPEDARSKWQAVKQKTPKSNDWPYLVSRPTREIRTGKDANGPKVAIIDYGSKENILRCMQERTREIAIFNSRTTSQEILDWHPDGVLLTNGPGDPAQVENSVEAIKEILGKKPLFGICMGHQLLARALGGRTFKLRFGHRGANHPVQDRILNRVYVTSQNHGYAVDEKSLPKDVEITHINLNDKTVQGLRSIKQKCFSVQFHPESHPGPQEGEALFEEFLRMMR